MPSSDSDDNIMSAVVNDDCYSTLDSLHGLWDATWRNMFSNGTWVSGTGVCQPINPQFDVTHPYACATCKRGPFTNGTKLFNCSQCKVVKYCCREHQKGDWKSHKAFCKAYVALKNANDTDYNELQNPRDKETWSRLSRSVTVKVETMIRSGLHSRDIQLVALQPRCNNCFVAGSVDSVELVTCPKCHDVALCKDCFMKDDISFHIAGDAGLVDCEYHQISLACSGMVVENGSILMMESDTDMKECFQPKDWREYFDMKRGDFLSQFPPVMLSMAPIVCLLIDGLSLPLTILHTLGLPDVMGGQGVAKLEHLVVHVVGASAQEMMGVEKFIELIRCIPTLKYLRICMFGPDVQDVEEYALNVVDPNLSKIRNGCDAKVMMRNGYYHDVVESLNEEATLVIASHPGMFDSHYTDSWRPTVEVLASKDVPFVVTGYNKQEVLNDRELLEKFGAKIVVEPSGNPFRGLRPFPDPSRECSDFIFGNSHFVVSKGSKKEK